MNASWVVVSVTPEPDRNGVQTVLLRLESDPDTTLTLTFRGDFPGLGSTTTFKVGGAGHLSWAAEEEK